ncbi:MULTISPECIES: hypothetical protein [Nitrospirillum]|uniref:Lipoprotein n=1 Tax=Nitrospirillum amazonense TaxID=28077 RepID=A0A560FUW2_9PROT|nr:hypothetical protein [Nitrospirillum amazonense]MEC4593685.1 hypothetical protein [Nitrospirillum amazonense]TWB25433.1 hypothetical protein FBZ88_110190 [Nitrospirillum amazonense]
MKTAALLLLGSTLLAAGCATQPLTPEDAIHYAAAVAPDVYSDTYVMDVVATGRQNGRIFLNSQEDYRDPHTLTIEILPSALPAFKQAYGEDADAHFKGHRVTVLGEARRVTIWYLNQSGERTGQSYYQTHIVVSDPDQIKIES